MVANGLFTLTVELPRETLILQPSEQRWWSVETPQGETERELIRHTLYATMATSVNPRSPLHGPVWIGRLHTPDTRPPGVPGYGDLLEFWGGNPFPPESSRNSDHLFIARYNVARDETELRVNIGDNADQFADAFVVGLTPVGSDEFLPRFRVGMNGEIELPTHSGYEVTFAGSNNPNIRADYNIIIDAPLVQVPVLRITGGSDLAEPFLASSSEVEPRPGMVLSIDPQTPGALRVSDEAYDTKVAGVYSGGNGLPTGMLMGKDGCELTSNGYDRLPLAMTGRVWVYADDSGGEIRPGDRLTTSGANAGYAARVADASRADGAVIGKAMTGIDEATGMVLVLVNLQ